MPTPAEIIDETLAMEREMRAIGRDDLARKARKLREKAQGVLLAAYYARGPGASVLADVAAGKAVKLRVEADAARPAPPTPPAPDNPALARLRTELRDAEAAIQAAYWCFSRSPSPRVGPPAGELYERRNRLAAEIRAEEQKTG